MAYCLVYEKSTINEPEILFLRPDDILKSHLGLLYNTVDIKFWKEATHLGIFF